jgi:hypothetical protein
MTPSGIDPATSRLVEQCLNQLRHRVLLFYMALLKRAIFAEIFATIFSREAYFVNVLQISTRCSTEYFWYMQ